MKKLLLLLIIPFLSFGQTPITQTNIYGAVNEWLMDSVTAEATYGHISNWNVSNVDDISFLFEGTLFNSPIGNWDVSNVQWMEWTFANSPFNQDISNWDVGNVELMTAMFESSAFNQNIGNWDVGNVVGMEWMFANSPFNQDIGNWDVSSVSMMPWMFQNATSFDQDIGGWNVENLNWSDMMFSGAQLSVANYDSLLIGWSNLNLSPSNNFDAGLSQYCNGEIARTYIINTFNWSISDGGPFSFSDCQISVSMEEVYVNKYLLKTIDILGRERNNNEGLQLHIYDDGSVEKKYVIK